jgi:hypothetical protein
MPNSYPIYGPERAEPLVLVPGPPPPEPELQPESVEDEGAGDEVSPDEDDPAI